MIAYLIGMLLVALSVTPVVDGYDPMDKSVPYMKYKAIPEPETDSYSKETLDKLGVEREAGTGYGSITPFLEQIFLIALEGDRRVY